ncbi:hypothetical protein K432DRAFT_385501 [Lepidopterella palustris CBS 459.81]|uniref:Uncharacterized protein n=1 Tax=Lepidopterella palustris CBS 459.81 TaxID=1314670 RepID=A0A8E2E371_9PEZI|nr:hypothetical protein K432DRAFT_385501 [Lepidopterella palustris CBS 459.81]
MDIEVVKRGGQQLSLKGSLNEALRALNEDGCLVLKGATSVDPASLDSSDFIKREIVLNEAVRTILFSTRNDGFRITACLPYKASLNHEVLGRDQEWEKMASVEGLVGAMCYHLGGDRNVSWIVQVDGCSRGAATGKVVEVRANGGDIFMCHHWLLRSKPFLEKEPPTEVHAIVVSYLWTGYSERGALDRRTGDKILEQFGNNCSRSGKYVVWKQ